MLNFLARHFDDAVKPAFRDMLIRGLYDEIQGPAFALGQSPFFQAPAQNFAGDPEVFDVIVKGIAKVAESDAGAAVRAIGSILSSYRRDGYAGRAQRLTEIKESLEGKIPPAAPVDDKYGLRQILSDSGQLARMSASGELAPFVRRIYDRDPSALDLIRQFWADKKRQDKIYSIPDGHPLKALADVYYELVESEFNKGSHKRKQDILFTLGEGIGTGHALDHFEKFFTGYAKSSPTEALATALSLRKMSPGPDGVGLRERIFRSLYHPELSLAEMHVQGNAMERLSILEKYKPYLRRGDKDVASLGNFARLARLCAGELGDNPTGLLRARDLAFYGSRSADDALELLMAASGKNVPFLDTTRQSYGWGFHSSPGRSASLLDIVKHSEELREEAMELWFTQVRQNIPGDPTWYMKELYGMATNSGIAWAPFKDECEKAWGEAAELVVKNDPKAMVGLLSVAWQMRGPASEVIARLLPDMPGMSPSAFQL